jgi:hypothetical protein
MHIRQCSSSVIVSDLTAGGIAQRSWSRQGHGRGLSDSYRFIPKFIKKRLLIRIESSGAAFPSLDFMKG